MKFQFWLSLVAAVSMTACGGGGGSSGASTGGSSTGGTGSGSATAPVWTAGVYNSESQYKDYCANPRSGADPYNSNQPYPDKAGSAMHEKMWLRSWSNRTYLWYRELPDRDPASYTVAAYFAQLKTEQSTASSAAKDQFHFTQDTASYNQQTQSGVSSGYGIEWSVQSTTVPRWFQVAYTEPNSPASNAMVKRGDIILEIDGVDFINDPSQAGVNTLNAGLFPAASGERHQFKFRRTDGTEYSLTLTAANVASSPVQNVKVLNTSAGKLGYMQFNSFITPAQPQLISAVQQFRDQAVSNLVIDLRYNGGGLLALSSQLGYMLTGPNIIQNRYFEKMQFNDKYPNTNPVTGASLAATPFYSKQINYEQNTLTSTSLPNLNLSRIFVLATGNTCSASEALINGLRGVDAEVILIGDRTCGKPYGFYPEDNCGTTYFTIQFSGINAKGFGDYADGFVPTPAPQFDDQVKGCAVADDFSHALGDPAEALLASAVEYAQSGSCPVSASSSTDNPSLRSDSRSAVPALLSTPAVRNPNDRVLNQSIRSPIHEQEQP
ncbi:S41 family peptidase [Rheinheimera marina]|uniref:S41 family peptidase n=1 Tax=Rheinheimera marina TaxID=1774958 RepID=A0ABV9JJE3_9GAMM